MKTIAMIPARLDSERLPGKLMMDLGGLPIILKTDPVVKLLNFSKGDVLKILRKDNNIFYRIVK